MRAFPDFFPTAPARASCLRSQDETNPTRGRVRPKQEVDGESEESAFGQRSLVTIGLLFPPEVTARHVPRMNDDLRLFSCASLR